MPHDSRISIDNFCNLLLETIPNCGGSSNCACCPADFEILPSTFFRFRGFRIHWKIGRLEDIARRGDCSGIVSATVFLSSIA